jgi:hypothetical protein
MVNTKTMGHVFKHPKYYEELRKKREENLEATSSKQQAIDETVPHCDIEEAASSKPQAPKDSSRKRQAASPEQQASSDKPRAASSKTSLPS